MNHPKTKIKEIDKALRNLSQGKFSSLNEERKAHLDKALRHGRRKIEVELGYQIHLREVSLGKYLWSSLSKKILIAKNRHNTGYESSSDTPYIGRVLVCLFVSPDKQEDRLADFEEMLNVVWIPRLGKRAGRTVYVWHALRSAGDVWWIGATGAIVDAIARVFRRLLGLN